MLGELFDPKAETQIYKHCRPHWSQAGAVVFITFRLADSIPQEVLERWDREKQEWLRVRGYDSRVDWKTFLPQLKESDREDFLREFNRCREEFLDTCHGSCILRRREVSKIVSDSLLHFDGQRYCMGDFVVMPNHVHLMTAFATQAALKEQCDSWLHYTAFRINQLIGSKGKLWQQEPFDHLVRSVEQYEYLRDYIQKNPTKAKLKVGEYIYRRFAG